MIYRLGNIEFKGFFAPNQLERNTKTDLSEIKRIGDKPLIQRTGEDLERITLNIQLSAKFCNPGAVIRELNEIRSAGKSNTLINGEGDVLGDFCIESLSQQVVKTTDTGAILIAEMELVLKEFISTSDTTPTGDAISPRETTAQLLGSDDAATNGAISTQDVANAVNATEQAMNVGEIAKAQAALAEATAAVNEATDSLQQVTGNADQAAQDLRNELIIAGGQISTIQGLLTANDLPTALQELDSLKITMRGVNRGNEALMGFTVA